MHRQMPVATHCGVVAEEGIALNKSGCRNQLAPDAQTNAGGHPLGGGSRRNNPKGIAAAVSNHAGYYPDRAEKIGKRFVVIPPREPTPLPLFQNQSMMGRFPGSRVRLTERLHTEERLKQKVSISRPSLFRNRVVPPSRESGLGKSLRPFSKGR